MGGGVPWMGARSSLIFLSQPFPTLQILPTRCISFSPAQCQRREGAGGKAVGSRRESFSLPEFLGECGNGGLAGLGERDGNIFVSPGPHPKSLAVSSCMALGEGPLRFCVLHSWAPAMPSFLSGFPCWSQVLVPSMDDGRKLG